MAQTTTLCEASSFRRRRVPKGYAVVDGRCRRAFLVALGALVLAWSQAAYAVGIFLPATATDFKPAVDQGVRKAALAKPGRRVRVAHEALNAGRDDLEIAGEGRLLLNVRDRVQLDVVVDRTARTGWGYSLSGRVVGEGVGFVTLVVHGEAVAGSIWTPASAYELNHLGDGIHALRDVTNAPPLECGGMLHSELPPAEATAHQGGTDDGSVVDVLVVWSPGAEDEFGSPRGEPQMLLGIDMMVAYANDALERSGALFTFRLVGAEKVDYADSWRWGDLKLDRVHDLRNALGADLVYLLSAFGPGRNHGAFSLGPLNGRTLAHEFGHALGMGHERIERQFGGPLRSYSHGFTTPDCDGTIMSYDSECNHRFRASVPLYASPWRYSPRDGSPLGVARLSKTRGARGPADAILTLNRNRHRVANLRPSHGRD